MTVEILYGTITKFFRGSREGQLRGPDGILYSFQLDDIKDGPLKEKLDDNWFPHLNIPVQFGVHRSSKGLVITHISSRAATKSNSTTNPLVSLPAEAGPYRDAKIHLAAGEFELAETRFLEAIRKGDRKSSAVKDLAQMLAQLERCQDAITLLNKQLALGDVASEEKKSYKNLRENIHNRLYKLGSPIPGTKGGSTFGRKIQDFLLAAPPHSPKADSTSAVNELPSQATMSPRTQRRFICLIQTGIVKPLVRWDTPHSLVKVQTNMAPNKNKAWDLAIADFDCGQEGKVVPTSLPNSVTQLEGAWLFNEPKSFWAMEMSCRSDRMLLVSRDIYLRDEDLIAGPWRFDQCNPSFLASPGSLKQWRWDKDTRRVDFPDRVFLLSVPVPDEGEPLKLPVANNKAESPINADAKAESSRAKDPPVLEPTKENTGPSSRVGIAESVDSTNLVRDSDVVDLTFNAQEAIFRPTLRTETAAVTGTNQELAWMMDSRNFVTHQLTKYFGEEDAHIFHLSTLACRCLLVPTPLHTYAYSKALGDEANFYLVTPSAAWLSLSDAWPHLEFIWNSAHLMDDRVHLLHIELANLTLLHFWAKPILNLGAGLGDAFTGFTDLPWPNNLRVHWSLSSGQCALAVLGNLRAAFGALPINTRIPELTAASVNTTESDRAKAVRTLGGVIPDTARRSKVSKEADELRRPGIDGTSPKWLMWSSVQTHQNLAVDPTYGEFAWGVATEVAKLKALLRAHGFAESLASEIRVDYPKAYFEGRHADSLV